MTQPRGCYGSSPSQAPRSMTELFKSTVFIGPVLLATHVSTLFWPQATDLIVELGIVA